MVRMAVFDLDRTLIHGSSAQTFGQMLRAMDVELPAPPGRSAYFALYRRFGEDPITMRLARHAAKLFKDQSMAAVEAAGRMTADVLASNLLAPADFELERHRSAGTKLLLATTAPSEVAGPFAEAVGFDDVLCTRYGSADGIYDGTNTSRYLWGEDKAAAVAEWAGDHTVDLTHSSAYSDSWYDIPLLELVGRPVAINADLRLNLVARTRNWQRHRWQ